MERVKELDIIIENLSNEFTKLKLYNDGSGIKGIIEKAEEIRNYHIERFKLTNPNEQIKDYLLTN